MTPWELHGRELANCNCATGCPCQFMALPTHGSCEAAAGFTFDSGHYGDVDLAGTRCAYIAKWPGAIHDGNGTMQLIVDAASSPAQRDALERIMKGEDTEDLATMWWVFSAMSPNKLETLVKPIEITVDVENRRGRMHVPDVMETTAEPLVNPVTGDAHRARIDLPNGFEFRLAEIARATTRTMGQLDLPGNTDSHAHLVDIHLSGTGVVAPA
ncbi:hypothetical protein TRM7557_01072 [Tritonibacter multivorans]|uniref:DUF1326 domain-containing protein n=1 Tax=Tritonibacter multivorans TaxID=928856 RepID=A0A0N7LZ66_9RHOB|nr:DUF1326 domain-containing protein [Tritonibacter multivorans]MDA7421822.1 DUF1326 domain-containing protein [Tritonibacter multivorans]CUH76809.1 hypothetical protein TRM7557_01072 [Tritonibacter multivorans]SFD06563.1 hypothetical protein SAMN04488049_106135 [Tritonibacter multivorans]